MKILELFIKSCYTTHGRIHGKKGEVSMNAISLSNYVIIQFENKGVPITNLKLQKVIYYIQGYFYRQFNRPAFLEEIYNWQYGPVVPEVYYEYNTNGSSALKPQLSCTDFSIEECEKKLVYSIVEKCSDISTSNLVSMTHSENPWKNSNPGGIISKKSIELFFKFNDPLRIKA
ncbi:MAG: DUF4065 domain-containing protein [Clostridia bacterium]|nr:DUF4065 domain-containing protein [Clostridia bacterium]